MRQYLADKIRNIALAGHGGCGKTSLAEAMLFKAGVTDRMGKIENGNTVCDYDPEEIKRKVSLSSSVASFEWNNTKFNVLDTPGLFDFATGLYEGIRAAGSVVVVLSAKDGVQVGTERAYHIAKDQDKSVMFFINNSDVEGADFYKVLDELRVTFGKQVCPLMIPYVKDKKTECYIDLLKDKAYKYDDKGVGTEIPIPEGALDIVEDFRNRINEAVAETDEALMDKFFGGESFTHEELVQGINEGFRLGNFFPVSCGSSITLEGIDMFLDCMVNHMPSAKNAGSETGTTPDGEDVRIKCDILEPLAAYVFKTISDPFIGRLSYVKVIGGKLTSDLTPINSRTGNPEKIGKIVSICGKKQEDIDSVAAGDIAAIRKLNDTETGDTLCDSKRVVSLRRVGYPMATLTMAVVPKNKGDEGKIAQAIQKIKEEDPLIKFVQDVETHQQLITGLGDQHLDVIVSKLKNKFGVEISLAKPRVAYRETIRKKVKVQGRHKKQSGGHGQFGDVWIEFEPCDSEGLVFEENIFGGSVPKNYFPAVEKGLTDSIKRGVLAGYPMVGLKATLVDGSYHPVDSSEMAFKTAASLAYKAGIPQASPVILEPIGNLKVYIPDDYAGDIMGDLNKRRGRIMGMNPWDTGIQEIEAEVPISEMYDFTTALRSMTQGRGNFVLKFERYEQLPAQLEAQVIAEAKALNGEE